MFLRAVDRALHVCVVAVAFGVDEEVVFPVDLFAGAFFDSRQINAALFEDVEDFGEGAGFVGGGEHDGGDVVAGFLGAFAADDEETGDVVGVVFDVFEEDAQAIHLAGDGGGDGGGAGFGGGEFGGLGRTGGGLDVAALGGGA